MALILSSRSKNVLLGMVWCHHNSFCLCGTYECQCFFWAYQLGYWRLSNNTTEFLALGLVQYFNALKSSLSSKALGETHIKSEKTRESGWLGIMFSWAYIEVLGVIWSIVDICLYQVWPWELWQLLLIFYNNKIYMSH